MKYLAFLAFLLLPGPAAACPGLEPCEIPSGSYQAEEPSTWDGKSKLPVVIYFHGYKQSGEVVRNSKWIANPILKAGALLIAPNGLNRTWAHQGAPSTRRDESKYFDDLLADIKSRWPIDNDRIWVTGFSQGGSMAWHIACFRGDKVSAFFPAAGAFWRPHPAECTSGPVNLAHAHGTKDTVVPMKGRAIGGGQWHQGDVEEGIAMWRDENQCIGAPARETWGAVQCRVWTGCGSGKALRLCLHNGGHKVPNGWLSAAMKWADKLARD